MAKTISGKVLSQRLETARQAPELAHLPSFGLMAPRSWNYQDPELRERAAAILAREGITGTVTECAPALFWYKDAQGELHLHHWTDICDCGHTKAEHDPDGRGPCGAENCDCTRFQTTP